MPGPAGHDGVVGAGHDVGGNELAIRDILHRQDKKPISTALDRNT